MCGGGTVFELVPNTKKTLWTHTILYGEKLYGTSDYGAVPRPVVFIELRRRRHGIRAGPERRQDAMDAYRPLQLLRASESRRRRRSRRRPDHGKAGKLYGTTGGGGAHGNGTVFELIPDATKTGWRETVV